MLLREFFRWWYGPGWRTASRVAGKELRLVLELFSVKQLSRTLLAPWRRIITYPGASLEAKLRAFGDNIFSRLVGFVIRVCVLCVAGLASGVIGLLSGILLGLWPLLPPAIPGLLVLAVVV